MSTVKRSLFETMRPDIEKIATSPEHAKRIEEMVWEAQVQTERREIIQTRTKQPRKKFMTLWKMRFYYGIHWSKPLYPLRLARNMFLGKLYDRLGIKKYVLRGIEFAGTYVCNFRCHHCLCSRIDESDVRREMAPEDYARVVKEAMKLGCTTFGLEGGEPFVSPVWKEIIEAFQPKYNHVIISTNGFLFTEEKARICADLGVDTINFSLDSGVPEMHDLFRVKKGSFERVMRGIEYCRKYGIKVIINTVVHKGNIYTDHFRKLLDFADGNRIMVNTLFAKGVGNFKDMDVLMSPEDIQNYERLIEPYNYVQRHLAHNFGKQFGCPGTKEMINMTPYGDVMNCANMHIYMGNVMQEPLTDIRARALKETPFGRYHSCFLADDWDFMNVYYPQLQKQSSLSIADFRKALKEYEKDNDKVVYAELVQEQGCTGCGSKS